MFENCGCIEGSLDYYGVLGLTKDCNDSDIKKA